MRKSVPMIVSEKILDDFIRNNELKPGDKLPTVRELSQKYGPISNNTLVHALSILESDGWICKKQGSGCYVSEREQSEDSGQGELIGFVVPASQSKLILDLHCGLDSICRLSGYNILMSAATLESVEEERAQVHRMERAGCSSIVVFPVVRTVEQLKDDYLKNEFGGTRIILVDMAYPELMRPRVIFDNQQAGYDMAQYLIRMGHRNIAFMYPEKTEPEVVNYSVFKRYQGFRDAVATYSSLGVVGSEWTLKNRSSEFRNWADLETNLQEKLYDTLVNWKNMKSRPTAVIAIEDHVASALINIARMMGISIHEDLTVVGFDNVLDPRVVFPTFTTTAPDFMKMGQVAARMAIERWDGAVDQQKTYILPVSLLERKLTEISIDDFAPAENESCRTTSNS